MLVAGLLVCGLFGCSKNKTEGMASGPESDTELVFPEEQVPPPEPQPMAASPHGTSLVDISASTGAGGPALTPLPKESYATPGGDGSQTYVVRKGDTLYSISRKFYNGESRHWRRIYEANRAALPGGPDRLEVGTKLVIP
jgi:nucleoid-associated protein YgaU